MSKHPSSQISHTALGKSSSIFEVDQIKNLKTRQEARSTTSFSYEPSHHDEKVVLVPHKRAILEPTYRLDPLVKIKVHAIKSIIDEVLQRHLSGRFVSFT